MSTWGEETGTEYSLLEPGKYTALLTNATIDDTNIDKPVINLEFQEKTTKLWMRLVFTETAMKFLSWQLGVLGVWSELKGSTNSHQAALKAADLLFNMVNKTEVVLEVSHRTYEGKQYHNVIVDSLSSGEPINHAPVLSNSKFNAEEELGF